MSVEQSITIVLGSCKNLRLTRGDAFTIFAQVTLGKTQLGESSRIECKIEENNCVLDLEVKYSLKVAEPLSFDEITNIYEVLPKDKKSKEEKTQLIGIANVDLLPLLQGHTKIEKNLKLNPLSAVSPPEDTPEIDVTISTMSSLLTPGDMEKSNILSLRVNGMYSLPEVLLTGQGSTFTIATPRPHIDSAPLNITGGELKNAGDVDLPQKIGHWRWSELPLSTTGIAALTNTSLDVNAVEDESGQLCTTQEDIDFRRAAESRKQRVIWNSELRAYLPPAHNSSFLNHLSHMPIWPIEVLRITPTVGKGKGKEEEPALSHHGMALVNMSSLLYPGNTKIFGAYCVEGMNEMELASKTNDGHVKSIMDQVHKSTGGIPGSIKKAAISAKRPSTAMRASLASIVSEAPNTAEVNKDVYVDSRTYILLEIELAHPLIPKRPASVISEKILEYIPPRPAIPRRLGGAEKAISDFHSATTDVVSLLLTDYKSLFGDALAENGELPNTDKDFEDRKRQLLYSLNTSGRYHAYKEHMKKSVVSLVREKFLNEANTKSDEEKQAFLSRLYAYLVDEMHIALGKIFSLEDSAPPPPTIIDCDMMMQFAHETELLLDLDTAEYYHKELLAKEEHIALHWYDYGVFHLLKGDTEHSEQCLKEAIALDQQFVPALLLYGMCCSLEEKFAEANEVMELATTIDPNNIIAWTIRGLCYELSTNALYRDMCFNKANKISYSDKEKTYISPKQKVHKEQEEEDSYSNQETPHETIEQHSDVVEGQETTAQPVESVAVPRTAEEESLQVESRVIHDKPPDKKTSNNASCGESSPYLQTAAYLLDVYAIKYAEMCLAHERLLCVKQHQQQQQNVDESGDEKQTINTTKLTKSEIENLLCVDYHIAVARLYLLQMDYKTAEKHLTKAVKEDILNPNPWALLGHCYYMSHKLTKAKDCYERVVEYVNPPAHVNTVLLRLADIYMKDKEYTKAKRTYLRACRKAPSNITWRGVGIACFMLKNYTEAEDALSEANILNNLDPTTWAYLALVCHETNRKEEAAQAVSFAIKTGLKDPSLMEELKNLSY